MLRASAGLIAATLAILLAGCGSDDDEANDDARPTSPAVEQDDQGEQDNQDEQRHPDVVDVTVERDGDAFSFTVTISSPYDSPDRYADGWRVVGPDGAVFGEHTLAHDHANEQPFTRTQTGVEIPDDVDEVTVEGRDQEYGYGGNTVTVPVPDE